MLGSKAWGIFKRGISFGAVSNTNFEINEEMKERNYPV